MIPRRVLMVLFIQLLLLHKRQQGDSPRTIKLLLDRRWKHAVNVVIVMKCQSDLFEVVFALSSGGRCSGLGHCRRPQRYQPQNPNQTSHQ